MGSVPEKISAELKGSEALEALLAEAKAHKTITLLFSSKEEAHNHALILQHYLSQHL